MTDAQTNDSNKTWLQKITVGNWLTIILLLVSGVVQWQRTQGQIDTQASSLKELGDNVKMLARADDLNRLEKASDQGLTNLNGLLNGANSRISDLGSRIGSVEVRLSGTASDVNNLRDRLSDLQRQSSISRFRDPPAISGLPDPTLR